MGEVYRGHDGKLGYAAAPGRRGSDAQTEAHSRARFQTSCTPLLLPYAANGPLRTCQPCKCSLCANPAALPLQHRALAGSDFLPDREYFLPYGARSTQHFRRNCSRFAADPFGGGLANALLFIGVNKIGDQTRPPGSRTSPKQFFEIWRIGLGMGRSPLPYRPGLG